MSSVLSFNEDEVIYMSQDDVGCTPDPDVFEEDHSITHDASFTATADKGQSLESTSSASRSSSGSLFFSL